MSEGLTTFLTKAAATGRKHGKKLAGGVASGTVGGVMVWALTTFCTKDEHHQTRLEIQTLREKVAVLEYAVEHPTKGQNP